MEQIENAVLMLTFSTMVLAFFMQVLNRNFLKLPLPWLEELAVFCMIYMVMLATEAGLRDGSQIAVTALVDRLNGRARMILRIFGKVVIIGFAMLVFINSLGLVQRQIAAGQTSPALKLPMAVPYLGITIAFGIITVVQSVLLVQLARDLAQGRIESDEEEIDETSEELAK